MSVELTHCKAAPANNIGAPGSSNEGNSFEQYELDVNKDLTLVNDFIYSLFFIGLVIVGAPFSWMGFP